MKMSVAAVAALILVGCGSQDKGGNNAAAGAGSPSGAQTIQPGQWEMATQMSSIDIPGAPPEVVQQMRAQQGRTNTERTCITPEQARNPLRELRDTVSGPRGADCRKLEDVFAGGAIRIRISCQRPGISQELSVQGSFTATTLTAAVSVNAQGPNVGGPGTTAMRLSTNLRGRRIGDCPADAAPRNGPPGAPPPPVQPGNGQ